VALMGGSVVSASGAAPLNGVLTGTSTGNGIQVRNDLSAASGSSAGLGTFSSSANLQALTGGMLKGAPITLTGAANQSVTFTIPGGAMTAAEVNQALTLASQLLAQQGIVNPTPSQIQAALVGGTVVGPNGATVLQGVLQNRTAPVAGVPTPPVTIPSTTGVTSASQTPSPLVGGNAPVPGVDGTRAPNSSEGARLGGRRGG
jgi:hypothetical protein